jgi:quercetin dioxygenase-like cupin family protein
MERSRIALGSLAVGILCAAAALAQPPGATVDPLLETDETVLGQPFFYPKGDAKITSSMVTLPPGSETIWHIHPVPLFAYVLQGELIVDYGSAGERVYRKGDSLVEAFEWPHMGRNGGRGPVKILVVYAGAEGVPNAVAADPR